MKTSPSVISPADVQSPASPDDVRTDRSTFHFTVRQSFHVFEAANAAKATKGSGFLLFQSLTKGIAMKNESAEILQSAESAASAFDALPDAFDDGDVAAPMSSVLPAPLLPDASPSAEDRAYSAVFVALLASILGGLAFHATDLAIVLGGGGAIALNLLLTMTA